MALTLRQMTYFVALADQGSFARAASVLNITQPALSLQIRDLEDGLGLDLVERLPRGVRLTSAGEAALRHMQRILVNVEDFKLDMQRQEGLAGEIKLGVIPTVAPYLLPPLLTALKLQDTALNLRVHEARTETLVQELLAGKLDAIVAVPLAGMTGVAATPLFEDRFLLAAAAPDVAHLSKGPEALRPTGLDPDALLLLDEGHCLADQALEVCSLNRTQTRADLGASSLSTLCGLVARGFGLTFLPEIAVTSETRGHPDLTLLRFAGPEPQRDVALIRRATSPEEGRIQALTTLLADVGRDLVGEARRVA